MGQDFFDIQYDFEIPAGFRRERERNKLTKKVVFNFPETLIDYIDKVLTILT